MVGKAKDLGYSLVKGVIGTKGILDCAQWIANHGPKNSVSYSFAVALNYAIAIRTSHGRVRSGKDLKSDERHQYFLGILEQVRETLSSLMDTKVAKAAGVHIDSAITLSNKFAQLEVEEPSEEFLQAPDVFLPPIKACFEEERDSREEALLAIELILEDYKSFRTVIRECWQEYHEGARDLIEISVMTNTAIDLARRLEADAKVLIDECGGLSTVFRQYCENSGDKVPLARAEPEDQNDFSVHELGEPFLGSTFTILEVFIRAIREDSLPITDASKEGPGALPELHKSQPFDPALAETKQKADEAFLHSMLLDFYIVTTKMKPILPEDELTRGLRVIFETKKLSLWVIFALQVYLDINYVLQDDLARGYWDFSKFAESVHVSINRNFELFQDIPCDPWSFSKDEALQQIQFDIRKVAEDNILRQRKNQLGLSAALMGGSNSHWKSHPIRCGLLAYNIRMRHQTLSVQFESKWQTIYYTYTLYYALRLQNLLRTPWKDMEALIKVQPQIDLSGRARTLSDLVIRVSTDLGWSARVAASDRRIGSRIPIVDQCDQHIRLQERNSVALMFKKRLCDNDGRTNFTEEDLVDILSKAVPVTNRKIQKSEKSDKNEKSKKSKKNKKNKRGHKSKKGQQNESTNDE